MSLIGRSTAARPTLCRGPRWPFTINWDSPLSRGLVGAWPLVDRILRDIAGRLHGTGSGPAFAPERGLTVVAARFSGSINDTVVLPAATFPNLTAGFTVSCWIHDTAHAVAERVLGAGQGGINGWACGANAGASEWLFTKNGVVDIGLTAAAPNDPFLLTFRYNDDSTIDLLFNGIVATGSANAQAILSRSELSHTAIGAGISAGGVYVEPWSQFLCFMTLHDVALPDDTVRSLYEDRWSLYHELGRRSWFLPAAVGTFAAIPPDAILAITNLSGVSDVTNIDDDPDSPDANWATATDPLAATDLRVGFGTPGS